ncbi:hypothetical protein J4444_00350 [Candidatus Woesearchaeota archaeon]|nr:hypothetical protein [Candidatus Woesearchaeota archaeon]
MRQIIPKHLLVTIISCILSLVLIFSVAAESAQTLTAYETDLVKLKVKATDLDNDNITYTYSQPFDIKGEWQPGYNDAGEYDINITASDGIHETVKKIKLIIKNKNRPPILLTNKLTVNESQTVNLKEFVKDWDNDPLSFEFQTPFDKNGNWKPTYQDEGSFVTTFTVSDNEKTINARVEIIVLHQNHAPTSDRSFTDLPKYQISEDQTLKYYIDVEDVDGDKLTYLWQWDAQTIGKEKAGKYYLEYDSAGNHSLKVFISDGLFNLSKEWQIQIKNLNRKPKISPAPITINEGETAKVIVPETDEDGDTLTYQFQSPLDKNGEWQTTYDDSGTYKFIVSAFDGLEMTNSTVQIAVLNVDRAPLLTIPSRLYVYEGQKGEWQINAVDPDKEAMKVSVKNLPPKASFNEKNNTLIWTPDYEVIKRSGGLLSNVLNKLRIEQLILRGKTYPIIVTSCSKNLCTSQTVSLVVHNVDRAPVLNKIPDITVKEGELATLQVSAVDPDGDIVHYYFTEPFGKSSGKWQTEAGDKGLYTISVTATDGKMGQTLPAKVKVVKNNRVPTLSIKDDELVVNEGQQFMFKVDASDPDNDTVQVRLDNLPPGASFKDGIFLWAPGYNTVINGTNSNWNSFLSRHLYLNKKMNKDEAVVWLSFTASDGEADKVIHPVKVTVKNVNRAPKIVSVSPALAEAESEITATVGQPVIFRVAVQDEDKDPLQYTWKLGIREDDVTGTNGIERTFVSSGKKTVKVIVSDSGEEVVQEWKVNAVYTPQTEQTEYLWPADPLNSQIPEQPFSVKVYVVRIN